MGVTIVLYDDSEALRESIRTLLSEESDFTVAAMFDNAETVETDFTELKPSVILMDIDMPNINGVEAVRRIRKLTSDTPILMLTVFDDSENIFSAICAGASGYILKRDISNELISAIRNVLGGGAPMSGSVAKKVLKMLPEGKTTEREPTVLTDREKEILVLLVNGHSYKMIAEQIKISLDGVRFHIKKIYDKLHVHSATEAVSKAIREKLV